MKTLLALLSFLSLSIGTQAKETIQIAALKSVELTYAEFGDFDVNLINKSGKPVSVAVLEPKTKKTVKSFGLGPIAEALLTVEKDQILKLTNNSTKEISLDLVFIEKKPDNYNPEFAPVLNFTLHNSSLKSIPLIIPNVMNPNLSPLSNSGVSLKLGQEIFYKKGSERILLLRVDESIQNGDKIDVAKLVRELDNF
jgi:hypothetical protein